MTLGGHVFSDEAEAELAKMERVTRPGGQVVFVPATNLEGATTEHALLLSHGYQWAAFTEPEEGIKRKYWKTVS